MVLKVKRLTKDAKLPTKGYRGDLGFDLYAAEDVTLLPGRVAIIPTGIAVELPIGTGAIIKERSSMAKKGFLVMAGVIDEGYRGPIQIVATAVSTPPCRVCEGEGCEVCHGTGLEEAIFISKGDKIAQLIILHNVARNYDVKEVEELAPSDRGEKGFGSTGK